MDGLAIISALLLGLGCVRTTLQRLVEALLPYLAYFNASPIFRGEHLQFVEGFQNLRKILQSISEPLKKSKLNLLTPISTNKELSNALLILPYLIALSCIHSSIHRGQPIHVHFLQLQTSYYRTG